MRRSRKLLAIVLAATMAVSSSIVAFASDPVTSGNTSGAGTSEGHLEKKVINVVLPTVPEGSTPFAYTMDPERLIRETEAAKYAEGSVFPAAETDTGVYFLTGTNTYANTSNTLQVVNKSSESVILSMTVQATAADSNPIDLGNTASTDEAETATLYLGLKVGTGENATETAVTTSSQSITRKIPGVADNFETAVVSGAYAYQVKSSASAWKAIDFAMTGAVTQSSAKDKNPPTVAVTWAYHEPATTEEKNLADSTDVSTFSEAPATYTVTYKANGGVGEDQTDDVTAGEHPAGPSTAFTREGYRLAGWATTNNGEAAALSTFTINAATDLYAIWTDKTTVTFDTGTGGPEVTSQEVAIGGKATRPSDPELSGKGFAGWYADSSFETVFDFDTAIPAEGKTIYAKWVDVETANILVTGGKSYVSKDGTDGLTGTVIKVVSGSTEWASSAWTQASNGWVTLNGAPTSGSKVTLICEDVWYEATVN